MNKKFLVFGLMGLFVMAFAAAGLVNYLSNTVEVDMDISSPISIDIDGKAELSLELFGGESKSVITTTTVHVDGVTGHIAQLKIADFDGVGIVIDYVTPAYPELVFRLNPCFSEEGDAYYYIGDPTEELPIGSFDSTTTFNTAFALNPERDYVVESQVIVATEAACTPSPYYTHPVA